MPASIAAPVGSAAVVSAAERVYSAALAGSRALLAARACSAAAVLAVAQAGFQASARALDELPVSVAEPAYSPAEASESDAKPVRSAAPLDSAVSCSALSCSAVPQSLACARCLAPVLDEPLESASTPECEHPSAGPYPAPVSASLTVPASSPELEPSGGQYGQE